MMRTPKYRRHSSGKAFVEWRKQRTYLPGKYDSEESQAAYRRFLREVVHSDRPEVVESKPASQLTVGDLVLAYLHHAELRYGRGRTEFSNMRDACNKLADLHLDTLLSDFGPRKLKQWRGWLVDYRHPTTGKRLSRKYINTLVNRVRRLFKWGVSEELVPVTVHQALCAVEGLRRGQTTAPDRPQRATVTWESVEAILPHLSPVARAMVLFQWRTAARSGSICRATPEQFDRTESLWLWRPRHKTEHRGHELVLPIGPQAQEVLRPLMDRDGDAYLFSPREAGENVNGRCRERYDAGSYRQAVQRAQRRHIETLPEEQRDGIAVWTPHQMRHARSTAIRDKYGIEAAQAFLGHASVEATQIYAGRRFQLACLAARESG